MTNSPCFVQAAAAMCVAMGSFSDPYKAQGLAHFLGLIVYTWIVLMQTALYYFTSSLVSAYFSAFYHSYMDKLK